MKTLTDHLAQYAAYHRDPRNIRTHLVGIPMIVAAVAVLLARVSLLAVDGQTVVSLATLAVAGSVWFYLRLDLGLGLIMAVLMGLALALGQWAALLAWGPWLALGVGGFVLGWIIQFVGHYFEGRKPAFVDDLVGLLVGPMFVVGEWLMAIGLLKGLRTVLADRSSS